MADDRFDLDLLDEEDPFEPPAHWLMVAEVEGTVLMVPLAPARDGSPKRCRPIGCYPASKHLADRYRSDR